MSRAKRAGSLTRQSASWRSSRRPLGKIRRKRTILPNVSAYTMLPIPPLYFIKLNRQYGRGSVSNRRAVYTVLYDVFCGNIYSKLIILISYPCSSFKIFNASIKVLCSPIKLTTHDDGLMC